MACVLLVSLAGIPTSLDLVVAQSMDLRIQLILCVLRIILDIYYFHCY